MKKKYLKIISGISVLPVVIGLLIFSFFVFSFLQNWLAFRIADYLSNKVGTDISIEKVDFDIWGNIYLHNVLIKDTCNDTLIYTKTLYAKLKDISFKKKHVFFTDATITNPFFNLHIYNYGTSNLDVLLKRLVSQDTSAKTSAKLKILFGNIEVENGAFKLYNDNQNYKVSAKVINFSDLELKKINLKINDFIIKDNLYFKVEQLSTIEKSGFSIKHGFLHASLSKHLFSITNVKIITNKSFLSLDSLILFNKNNSVFSEIISNTEFRAHFNHTAFSLDDIKYFTGNSFPSTSTFILNGNVYGNLSNLHLKEMSLLWGDSSYLDLTGNINGLPDVKNTLFYLDLQKLKTNKSDLDSLIKGLVSDSTYALPTILNKVGTVNYSGNLTGFYNDFVLYGILKTDLGIIKTDISFKKEKSLLLSGNLSTENLKINILTDVADSILGDLTMSGKIKGEIRDGGDFNFYLKATNSSLTFNGYNYKNIDVDGVLDKTSFDGEVVVRDSALKMIFLGQVDFSEKQPIFYFTADVKQAHIKKMFKNNSTLGVDSLKFLLKSKISGSSPYDLLGEIELYQTVFYSLDEAFSINNLIVKIKNDTGSSKLLTIDSDILNGKINYEMNSLSDVQNLIANAAKKYYTFIQLDNKPLASTFVSGKIDINRAKIFNHFFLPFDVSNNSDMEFYLGNIDSVFFAFNSDTITYSSVSLFDFNAYLNLINEKKTRIGLYSTKIKSGTYTLDSINLDAIVCSDTANLQLLWHTVYDSLLYSGDLQAEMIITDTTSFRFDFIPSYFTIANRMWYVSPGVVLLFDSLVVVKDFALNHGNELIFIDGEISKNKEDTLNVIIEELSLNHFNTFLNHYGLEIYGQANGNIKLSALTEKVVAESNITINDFVFNQEKFGKLQINTSWDNANKRLYTNAFLLRHKLKTIELKGFYEVNTGGLDFQLFTRRLLLKHFSPFLTGIIDDLRGLADGKINIKGTLSHPLMEGVINLKKVIFTVDFLKTRYNFTAPLEVNYKGFFINDFVLYDNVGNNAKTSIAFLHDNFSDLRYTIDIETNKFLFLNTTEKDNDLFYGEVASSGNISINGNLKGMDLKGNLKTEKPTIFNLLLESPEGMEEYGFITFVNKNANDDTIKVVKSALTDEKNISMDFNIKATDNATVQLIFDSKAGDIIKANGTGDINIKLNKIGDLIIKGEYKIEKGTYLFTLQDMINKKFDIKKGSYIKWNGDPYKAFLNITAGYKLKTSLYDLTLDSNDRKNVYVECLMYMANRLDEPDVRFGIDIKSANPKAKSIISSMNQEEIMKQVIMLMVLGRFYTPEQFRQNSEFVEDNSQGGALGMNASELLSEQLSYWLSQISKDFDVGVKYVPGNEISHSELEVALSTQLFNDRLLVNGNVNVGGNVPTASGVAGDVSVELKLNQRGTIRLKGFNRTNDDILTYQDAPYTQGIGIFYTENFNTVGELLRKYYTGVFDKIFVKIKNIKNQKKKVQ